MAEFDRKDWDLDFRAELYKQEFFGSAGWAASARKPLIGRWTGSTTAELKYLHELKELERSAHLGEIIREQQAPVMIAFWYDRLEIGPTSHPLTAELLHASIYLGGAVALCFKDSFNRVRPSVLAPDLSPPIPVPGAPSYPGGHAAQMYLMARTLAHLGPEKHDEIMSIAKNVAVNRERAGVNYPSDTEAGQELADRIFAILTSECEMFQSMLEKATQTG